MYYETTKNYAKFRRELLMLCPHMDEREIYKNWWMYHTHSEPGADWTLQQVPLRGVDSKYHYLYITTPFSTEELYVGIHSTLNLDDGYSGSGDEVRKYKDDGVLLKTTVLEFFRTREEALAMEEHVVNAMFILEPGVLNKTIGGDDSRHNSVEEPELVIPPKKYNSCPKVAEQPQHSMLLKKVSVEMPFGESVEVPVMEDSDKKETTNKETPKVEVTKKPAKKYPPNWFPFSRFGIKKGDKLVYIADNSIVADVLNDEDRIKVNGEVGGLKAVTEKIAKKKVANCLRFWMWNGKSLFDLKNEILKKGG